MPWKVVGNCLHKLNADGSVGKVVPGGCHKTPGEAQAHKRALYANVEEKPMSKAKRIKEKSRRERRNLEIENQQDLEELEKESLLEDELNPEDSAEVIEKGDYEEMAEMGYNAGPTSFEELDQARAAEHKAHMIAMASYDVQDLVRNIIRSPMLQGVEKANAIKKAGTDFGDRVSGIMDTPAEMLKEHDPEVLEVEAILAHDERNKTLLEKALSMFQKRELSAGAREKLAEGDFALPEKKKYPIHDKAHVRNALARAAQQLKAGGEGAEDARKALPKIRAAAKRMGIETSMDKEHTGIIVQKDAQGDWRWVGWPSNNFKDRSNDILTEAAHQEYVDWWHKEKRDFPVFTSLHAPGTARTYPVDFVGYENGFLVMSGKLTETEATRLLTIQKKYDLGMSHTGWGVRSTEDPRQIVMYRIFEVTDLPIEMADNPFTDLSVISKEADMKNEDQLAYLTDLLGNEEEAKQALSSKTSMKQKELQEAQVEQKETPAEPEKPAAVVNVNMQDIIKQIGEEFDIEGLNLFVQNAQETVEKVGLLESVVKEQQATIQKLTGDQDEKLAKMLTPPAGRFAWSKARASQSDDSVVEGTEKEKLQKKQAGIPAGDEYWLSQATNTAPVAE